MTMIKTMKRMALALAAVLMLATPAMADEVCRWGPAEAAVERLIALNPGAEVSTMLNNNGSNPEDMSRIMELVRIWNSTPPLEDSINLNDVVEVVVLDYQGASTIMVMYIGEKCFLGGMEVPKNSGPRWSPEQGS